MVARSLNIEARHQGHGGMIANITDFTTTAGSSIDPAIILSSPNLSLYCFDAATQEAIFTDLPDGVDLSLVPFVYQTQYEQAQRLIAVPWEDFRQLAQTLPPVDRLIMIYISGRSGSTLLSHIFNEVSSVMSLSEPDVGTQFLHLRDAGAMSDAALRDLLDCTVRILFKPTPFKTPTIYALKLRAEAVRVMDLYQETFPNVKNLYSYRDAIGFAASFYRMLMKLGLPATMPTAEFKQLFAETTLKDFTPMLRYVDPDAETMNLHEYLVLWWMANTEWYLEKFDAGFPVMAVSYAALNGQREAVIKAIFDYCGLPTDQIEEALSAYERDSQAGTILARENPSEGNKIRFTETQLNDITHILAQHPVIKTSDFVAPGSITL